MRSACCQPALRMVSKQLHDVDAVADNAQEIHTVAQAILPSPSRAMVAIPTSLSRAMASPNMAMDSSRAEAMVPPQVMLLLKHPLYMHQIDVAN